MMKKSQPVKFFFLKAWNVFPVIGKHTDVVGTDCFFLTISINILYKTKFQYDRFPTSFYGVGHNNFIF